MSKKSIAIYRVPTAQATRVGEVRVVVDRRGQVYLGGSKVVSASTSGDFVIVGVASGQTYVVKGRDYGELQQ